MASQDTESIEMHDSPLGDSASAVGHRYKSFKRKFGKQKIKFEHAMKEGNSLVKEELRVVDLAKRLKEQNDQLLELLLELNSTVHIPSNLRYTLDVREDSLRRLGSPQPVDPVAAQYDAPTAREKLNEARQRLLAGEVSPESCRELEESILHSQAFAPTRHFSSLLEIPHTTTSTGENTAQESDMDSTLGFLSPEHDDECYGTLDSINGNGRSTTKPQPIDKDKEVSLRNPVSVYNWLKKHQPQVFTHDGEREPPPEKQPPARSSGTRTSKRAAAQVPKEEDVYDEDGILLDVAEPPPTGGGSSRSKRKREEDGMYHPKSGTGGRSRKRRGGEEGSKRAKRSSAASTA